MVGCEGQRVNYVFGLARNDRLQALVGYAEGQAAVRFAATGERMRRFEELEYRRLVSRSHARRGGGPGRVHGQGFPPALRRRPT
jgi:hypothetical protein